MTSPFQLSKSQSSSSNLALTSSSPLSKNHWSQTCHETILASNDNNYSIKLPITGGADNGQFIYFNTLISLLKNNTTAIILKGNKIDIDEILLQVDQHPIAGCTLADANSIIEKLSANGRQIKLETVKSGLTKDLRQFLDGRFEKGSIDHNLQQTIRDNVYLRTVPCTTRPPRSGEINGQDYTFLSVKDFSTLEKNGNLLESGVYKGHYYGTPRPTKETIITNNNFLTRSNSTNEMFQQNDPEFFDNENLSSTLTGDFLKTSLRKSSNGFGFTIVHKNEKDNKYLQIKTILPDGPAIKDGKLQPGDILVYINNTNVLNFGHSDVVKIFQSISLGDVVDFTICRGYPLEIDFNDPQVDVVSLNGVHHLPNGGYEEYQSYQNSNIHTVKIRKGSKNFGFTIANSLSGQIVKSIIDVERCQNLCINDLLLSINGQDLTGKQHSDVVEILSKCSTETDTIFVVQRNDPNVDLFNENNHLEKPVQENDQIEIEQFSSKLNDKTSGPSIDTISNRSRTTFPSETIINDFSNLNTNETFQPESLYIFDRQTDLTSSARNIRPKTEQPTRSKTPGPEFGATSSIHQTKPRSRTPTSHEFSSNTLQNSRSLQSVQPAYSEIIVNLTLSHPNESFGLRIIGGEEEKSQVSIGHIISNSPADFDGRLCVGDEIIKIDNHSTIRASHEKVVQYMQRAKEKRNVCLIVRRYANPNDNNRSYSTTNHHHHHKTSNENRMRHVKLQKTNENQSFGFVIISPQNKFHPTIGQIIPNTPAEQCGQLQIDDRILAVNGVNITDMVQNDVVNLIKDSGRTITLTVSSDEKSIGNHISSNGIRPSSSSPTSFPNENNQILKDASSHTSIQMPEKKENQSKIKINNTYKSSFSSDEYFIVDLQRPSINGSFGFSIRGGREFSIPLFILKLAQNGPAEQDGRMKPGDQIIEINGRSTYGMTHTEATSLIRDGGLYVRLLLRKTNAPPPTLEEVQAAIGNGFHFKNVNWKPSSYT